MAIFKIVIVVALLHVGNAVHAQSQPAGVAGFLARFSQYRRTTSTQSVVNRRSDLNLEGVSRITRHDFKSKQPAPGERNTYLTFRLVVFEYASVESADSAFNAMRTGIVAKQNELPDKSPVYVLRDGPRIYWLSGACLYSRTNWNAIEAKLQHAVLGQTQPAGDKVVKILCGGELAMT